MKLKKKLLFIVILLFVLSCKSQERYFNKDVLSEIKIENHKLVEIIDEYLKLYKTDYFALAIYSDNFFDNSSQFYIRDASVVSKIFEFPISYYSIYKNNLVLIYSKKDRYVNPRKYSVDFVNYVKKTLDDNWTEIETEDGRLRSVGNFLIRHLPTWSFKEGELIKDVKLYTSEYLYGKDDFIFTDIDPLDDIRIIRFKGD
ncbi:MAG: hypothetical protein R2785_01820 [Flavobacteriaceae bacterium]